MTDSPQPGTKRATVPEDYSGQRVDKVLANLFPEYSRSALQKWLKQGRVLVDDELLSQKDKVHGGESIDLIPVMEVVEEAPAQALVIEIVYKDDDILVVNKPAGLVVHPGAGNLDHTLLNGLLHLDASLRQLPRAGIVHRLDKDTSGLMVVARNEQTRLNLIEQLESRLMGRQYIALVFGDMISGCTIDEPIGRDPGDRRRMAIRQDGRPAQTMVRVTRRFGPISQVRCTLKTGRTHQIRVHLRHIGFPIVGDPVYGSKRRIPPGLSVELRQNITQFNRQALHATELRLEHPRTSKSMNWVVEPPSDIHQLINALDAELTDVH